MAVVAVKSQQITDRDAQPRVPVNARLDGAFLHHSRDTVAIANGDSAASVYRVLQVPSNALVAAIRESAPDIGTTTTADVGLYRTTQDGGAVVDADFFASAIVLNAGATNKVDITHESGVYTLANANKPLWQALGLTEDPKIMYDVAFTLVGAADAAGTALLEADWTQ